jgi:hypothetical protein
VCLASRAHSVLSGCGSPDEAKRNPGAPQTAAQLRSMRKCKKPPGLASGLQAAGKMKSAYPSRRSSTTIRLHRAIQVQLKSTTVKSPTLKSRIQANAAIKTQVTRKIQQYPKVPNAATCAAMEESSTKMTTLSVRFESARKLFTDLEKNSSK